MNADFGTTSIFLKSPRSAGKKCLENEHEVDQQSGFFFVNLVDSEVLAQCGQNMKFSKEGMGQSFAPPFGDFFAETWLFWKIFMKFPQTDQGMNAIVPNTLTYHFLAILAIKLRSNALLLPPSLIHLKVP